MSERQRSPQEQLVAIPGEEVVDVRLKRAYDPVAATDGYRVLVDRIWPRGVTREEAHLDEWARELAPSTGLRRWFGHDPARFEEFQRRYIEELASQAQKLRELRARARGNLDARLRGPRHRPQRRSRACGALAQGHAVTVIAVARLARVAVERR